MARRNHLTEEEKEAERARARHFAYLKHLGQGGFVDASEMQARIRKLYDVHQISFQRIADKTGVDVANIKWHYHGRSYARPTVPLKQCRWATHNAIMTTPFGPADVRSQVRAHGTQRRLRALVAAGYPQIWLGQATGRTLAHLNNFLVKNRTEVSSEYATTVEQVYRKYIDVDPVSIGVPSRSATYSRKVAAKRGYAPGVCWDDDTLDDPTAVPEWTGRCGSVEGYKIHLREDIPVCPACNEAAGRHPTEEVDTTPAGKFSPVKFRILIERRGLTNGEAAQLCGATIDSIQRWSAGERTPGSKFVEQICAGLDCITDDIFAGADERAYTDRDFDRHAFILALEEKKMSKRQIAIEIGVSNMAVTYWCSGKNTPKIPKIVKAAEVLGMDWKEFYR